MKGSLIIVGFFILGLIVGNGCEMPSWIGSMSFVALCCLLLCVGIGVGINPDISKEMKSLSPRLALLPIATILGSWMGSMAVYLITHIDMASIISQHSLSDYMAINSGFAYYSLSSIFITEYRGAELGTIALLANVIREMATLLLTPLIARIFGPLAPISSGGATTMDTTLPIISHTIGSRYVALSIYHGFVCDFSVPVLVTMWCSMG